MFLKRRWFYFFLFITWVEFFGVFKDFVLRIRLRIRRIKWWFVNGDVK